MISKETTKDRERRASTPESLQSLDWGDEEELEHEEEVESQIVAERSSRNNISEGLAKQETNHPTNSEAQPEAEPKDDMSDRIVVEVRDSQEPEDSSQEFTSGTPTTTLSKSIGEGKGRGQDIEMENGSQTATQNATQGSGSESKTKPSDEFDWEVPDDEEQDENRPPKRLKLLSSPIEHRSHGKGKRKASTASRRVSFGTPLQNTPRANGTPRSNATPRRKPGRRAIVNSSPEPEGEAVDEFFNARTSLQKYLPRITNSKLISALPELFQSDHTQVSRDIAKIGAASREIRNFIDRNKSNGDRKAIGKDLIRNLVKEVESDFDGLKKLASLLNDFGPRIRTVTAQLGGLLEDMREVAGEESDVEELECPVVEDGKPVLLSTANAERVTVEGFGNHKNRRYPPPQQDEDEEAGDDTEVTVVAPPWAKSTVRAALAVNHEPTSEVDPYEPLESSMVTVIADGGNKQEEVVGADSEFDDDDWKEEELVALFEGMESVHGERKIQKIYEKYSKALCGRTLEEVVDKVAQVRKGFEDEGLTVKDVGGGWWSEA
ncbi:hypothetical protein BJ508DRAFT_56371 [Ascobolus immersus RN42]|uniref:Uncharacterized protein n=1 Tax=Ascobolus immersus RN42 TaxID=1160509 RepID=A0A3N4IDW0_ASCIM|nr:hypothetical protein BJ508DRAFT_56371 [Ascobolus immersus RN42]